MEPDVTLREQILSLERAAREADAMERYALAMRPRMRAEQLRAQLEGAEPPIAA